MNSFYNELDRIDDEIQMVYVRYSQKREALMQEFYDEVNEVMTKHRELVDFFMIAEKAAEIKGDNDNGK